MILLAGNVALAMGPWLVRFNTEAAGIGPISAALWRLALAAPVLLLVMRGTGQRIGGMSRGMLALVLVGGVCFAIDLAAWHVGILQTKLANATLFGNSTALLFPIYGFIAARALPSRMQAIALGLAFAGAILLLGRSYELSPRNLVGDLLCLLAGLFYTFYMIVMDRARATYAPWPLLAIASLASIAPLALFAALAGEPMWPTHWGPPLLLALVSQVIGQGLVIIAMAHVRPLLVGLLLLIQPIVGGVVGWAFYGEGVGALDVVGAVLIGAAIMLVRRDAPRVEKPA